MIKSEAVVKSIAAPLNELDIARLSEDCNERLSDLPTHKAELDRLQKAIQQAIITKQGVTAEQRLDKSILALWPEVLRESKERLVSLDKTIGELQTAGAERTKAHKDELRKLLTLKDRIKLRERMPAVISFVERSKWADKANAIMGKFKSLGRSLTDLSKVASEQLLNQDFEKLFLTECAHLRAPVVSVDFTGKRGQASRKKSLVAGHKLSDILSEGEQKVIALADFIAESSLRRKGSPIVFDDPVNSLDYKRLKHVVERIYGLSKTRQIIIFTHNIWFASELLERFRKDKNSCSYFEISSEGTTKGLISAASNPRTDSWKDFRKKIDDLIKLAEKETNIEVKEALVKNAYDYMRGACEVFVETDLFQEVTKRHRPNVMMTKLSEIRADRLPAAVEVVNTVFDKCCDFIPAHSHSIETLNVRPNLDELKSEWTMLQKARDEYLKEDKTA